MDYVEIELEELTVEEVYEMFFNGELDVVDMLNLSYNINLDSYKGE